MADKPSPTHAQASALFGQDKHPSPISGRLVHFSSPSPFQSLQLSSLSNSLTMAPTLTMAPETTISDRSASSMAPPPPPQTYPSEPRKLNNGNNGNLMSPPDPLFDSFHAGTTTMVRSGSVGGRQVLMSPPISPCSRPIPAAASGASLIAPPSQPVQDPVLYPADDNCPSSPPALPLFAPAEVEHHQRIVDDHVRERSQHIFGGVVAPPRREDYELVLTFRSQVMKHFTADRKGWLRKERAFLVADRRAGAQRYQSILPARPIAAKIPRQRVDRVAKPHAAPRPMRAGGSTVVAGVVSNTAKPAGRTSATPEPSRRIVAPNREDKDFGSIPDYCPPLSSLPNRPNSLKVDWKGQPIDLSGDPHASLLHADELLLAGNLRLDCATYLTSKRRVFERRLQCLRTGKEFRKTDAQQACKIDVNKASKLWTAFEKVGWLDAAWVRPFL